MKSLLRISLPLLLTLMSGCAGSSPRGLSWGFGSKSKQQVAAKKTDSDRSKSGSRNLANKSSKKSSSDEGKSDDSLAVSGGKKSVDKKELANVDLLEQAREADSRNDLKEARKLYEQILAKDPEHPSAIRRLANISDLEKRFEEAEEYYNRGLKIRPSDADLLSDLGYSYYLQGKLDESEKTLQKAIALQPDNPYALNNLGYVHVKRAQNQNDPREYQFATELFKRANGEETAVAMLHEAFPNGPPQAMAQTDGVANPFRDPAGGPNARRNPFEPDRPVVTPNAGANEIQVAERNQSPGMEAPARPVGATQPLNQGPQVQHASSPGGQGDMNTQSPAAAPIANSFPVAAPTSTPLAGSPSASPLPGNPSPERRSSSAMPGENPFEVPQQGNSQSQLGLNGVNTPVAPESFTQNQRAPLQEIPGENGISQSPWNSTPGNGGGSESATWEAAQRAAAQMSLSTFFPVSDATGRPLAQSGFSNGSGAIGNPTLNGATSGNRALERPLVPSYGGDPGNPSAQPGMISPNGNGWQSESNNSGPGFPAPGPFDSQGSNSTNGNFRNGLQQGGYQQPAFGEPQRQIQQTGASFGEIQQFEAELNQTPYQRGNSALRNQSSNPGRSTGPTIQPANAVYQ